MTRYKSLFAAAVMSAAVALTGAAQAQNSNYVHFVGAGSSAQFIMSAIAADRAAIDACGAPVGSNACTGAYAGYTINHWSYGNGAYLSDNRDSLGRIQNQTGNIWLVWIENSGAVADAWLDVSVDSTVGVRCFSAQENIGGVQTGGCQVQITTANNAGSQNKVLATNQQSLWPDNTNDVAIDAAVFNLINTSVTGGVHVNVGLTDIRPEDALYATKRSIAALDTTAYKGLGYVGPTTNIGATIFTDQGLLQGGSSTGSSAQPIMFGLSGLKDPFNTHYLVPSYTTIPIGAAPIVFIENNGGSTPFATNLVSGVTPDLHATGQTYPLAHLFDGTTSCDTTNVAFGGSGAGTGHGVDLFLREPLSGTMNTTEFNLFRSFDNSSDSQEVGVVNPAGGSPYNPLQLKCTGSGASTAAYRSRAIGTGEVVGKSGSYGVLDTPYSLGYIFTGWGNLGKFSGGAAYNYLTLDQADPIFDTPTAYSVCVGGGAAPGTVCGANEPCTLGVCTAGGNAFQNVPFCNTNNCTSDLWASNVNYPANATYPNVRYGLYKAWSLYRWIAVPNTDPSGPAKVAQEAQNYVDGAIADFIPFQACTPGTYPCTTGLTDGLSLFRSHFTPTGVVLTGSCTLSNGSVTPSNGFDTGNDLGGGTECGGDVGGLVYGPFGTTTPSESYVTWTTTHTVNKGYKLTWKNGDKFTTSQPANGSSVTLICTDSTGVQNVVNTTVVNSAGSIYAAVANPDTTTTIGCELIAGSFTHGSASSTQDGSTYHSKHQ